jgi:hypothetical protein
VSGGLGCLDRGRRCLTSARRLVARALARGRPALGIDAGCRRRGRLRRGSRGRARPRCCGRGYSRGALLLLRSGSGRIRARRSSGLVPGLGLGQRPHEPIRSRCGCRRRSMGMRVLVRSFGLQGIACPCQASAGNRRGRTRATCTTAQAGRTIGWAPFRRRVALPIVRSHAGSDDHGSRSRDRQCGCRVSLTGTAEQGGRAQTGETQAAKTQAAKTQAADAQRPAGQRPGAQGCNDTFCEPTAQAASGPHPPSIARPARLARRAGRDCVPLTPQSISVARGLPTFCAPSSPSERLRGVFSPGGDGASGARVHPGCIQRK